MTVFFAVAFVRALGHQTIRSGAFSYGLFTGITAVGLWRERAWGRSIGLVIALGTSALGVLATLAALVSKRGSFIGPLLLFVVSTAVAYLLNLRIFTHGD